MTVYKNDFILAGTTVRVTVDGPCVPEHIEARFGAYARASGATSLSPPASLHVVIAAGWKPPREPRVEYPGPDGSRRDDGTIHFFRSSEELLWSPAERVGRGALGPFKLRARPVIDATEIDTPLRQILSYDLPEHGGLLMHGAGYGDERGAVVFLAPTRGGKTTTSRKLPEAHVLSDDQVALRRVDGIWRAFALPFIGDFGKATVPRDAPLRALVLLDKAPTLRLRRVDPARALAPTLACTVRFVRNADPSALLALAHGLVGEVPVYRLALSKDEPVMPVVEGFLA